MNNSLMVFSTQLLLRTIVLGCAAAFFAALAHAQTALPPAPPLAAQGELTGAQASTKAAASDVNPEADYKVGPQDLLEVAVWGQPDMARTVRVNVQGKISLPLIGALNVVGLTAQQTERLIADRLTEKYLQDPQVTVFIKEFTTLRFTVEGAVNKPGVYPLVGQMTLLRALAVAGGQGQLSDMSRVMLFRVDGNAKRTAVTIDAEQIRAGEIVDPLLQNDDLVVVNRSKSRIAVKDSLFRDVWDILNPFSVLRGF